MSNPDASSALSRTKAVLTIPPENTEAEGALFGRPVEVERVVEHGDQSRQVQDDEQAHARSRNSCNDDDSNFEFPGDVKRTLADCGIAECLADTGITPGRAAFLLSSDLSRLAARQGDAAGELLQVSSSTVPPSAVALDPRKDPRKDPEVLNTLTALGQAVGLQAKAVGLMEEVVSRTVHLRVSESEENTV